MKLGAFVQQGKTGPMIHYGPLGKYIQMVKSISLIYLIMDPKFKKAILADLWDESHNLPSMPENLVGHYYILEVDGLSNTITICPPMTYPMSEKIEMDKEEYNRIHRDGFHPNITLSFDDVLAFRFLNVRERAAQKEDRVTSEGGEELTSEPMESDSDDSPNVSA